MQLLSYRAQGLELRHSVAGRSVRLGAGADFSFPPSRKVLLLEYVRHSLQAVVHQQA